MNVVQALAVAAAALALSGNELGGRVAQAEAHLEAVAARGETLAQSFTIKAAAHGDEDCANTPRPAGAAHKRLPDTSIHVAMSSARL
jgi:hypothetical protein